MPDSAFDLVAIEDALDTLIRFQKYLKIAGEDSLDPSARDIILWHYIQESDRLLNEARAAVIRARRKV